MKGGAATAVATAAVIGAPQVARAQEKIRWKMTTSFPPGLPFYQSGPGSAEWIVDQIDKLSAGRLKIKLYPAGELITWNGGSDAVKSGTGQANSAVA